MPLGELRRCIIDMRSHDSEAWSDDLSNGPGCRSLGIARGVGEKPRIEKDDRRLTAAGDNTYPKDALFVEAVGDDGDEHG